MMRIPTLGEMRKALAAAGAATGVAVVYGLIDNETASWVEGVIAVVSVFIATFSVKANDPPPTKGERNG